MHVRPYQRIIAWQEAHKLCLYIYEITKKFPTEERFRLVNQMCRSSYGTPMNIAEGNMKNSKKDKAHFYEIGLGSLEELHYQSVLAHDLGYINDEEFDRIDDHIQRTSFLLTKLRAGVLASSASSVSSHSSHS